MSYLVAAVAFLVGLAGLGMIWKGKAKAGRSEALERARMAARVAKREADALERAAAEANTRLGDAQDAEQGVRDAVEAEQAEAAGDGGADPTVRRRRWESELGKD